MFVSDLDLSYCERDNNYDAYCRMGALKGAQQTIHLAVDAHDMPVRVVITAGTTADCTQDIALLGKITAEYLLSNRGYDNDEIIS